MTAINNILEHFALKEGAQPMWIVLPRPTVPRKEGSVARTTSASPALLREQPRMSEISHAPTRSPHWRVQTGSAPPRGPAYPESAKALRTARTFQEAPCATLIYINVLAATTLQRRFATLHAPTPTASPSSASFRAAWWAAPQVQSASLATQPAWAWKGRSVAPTIAGVPARPMPNARQARVATFSHV